MRIEQGKSISSLRGGIESPAFFDTLLERDPVTGGGDFR